MFKKVLVLILFLLGFVLFFIYYNSIKIKEIEINKQKKVENVEKLESDDQNEENNQESPTIDYEKISLRDLIALDQNLECSWRIEKAEISQDADAENVDEEDSGGIEKGKIFFKEGDFFQETEITENSRKTFIKTLKKGDWFYQWNSLVANQGVKMSFERAKNSEFLKMDKAYDWNCQEFSDSEDVFKIPEGIRFLNF
jgi:hypothetical protein